MSLFNTLILVGVLLGIVALSFTAVGPVAVATITDVDSKLNLPQSSVTITVITHVVGVVTVGAVYVVVALVGLPKDPPVHELDHS